MQQDQSVALEQPVAAMLSTMALSDWRGSATTFAWFTGTIPVTELRDATWDVISALLAPTEPAILFDTTMKMEQ